MVVQVNRSWRVGGLVEGINSILTKKYVVFGKDLNQPLPIFTRSKVEYDER
jgi:hypothetical protein